MFDFTKLDELAKRLVEALPDNLRQFEQSLEQQFKEILQSTFSRLDLVTREEFDVQTKVLARTREKIEILQQQVDLLLANQEINLKLLSK